MNIHELATDAGEDVYYDHDFMIMIESHFTYLRDLQTTTRQTVEPAIAHKYQGDFNGLLNYMRIPKQYHNIILRFNGMRCTGDYTREHLYFLVPDINEIDLIKSIYETRNTKL